MVLRLLTAEEMVAISAAWVMADEAGRAAIEKVPLLAALLPSMEKVHSAIFALRAKEPSGLGTLRERENETDARHDALVHVIFDSLTMLSTVSPQAQELRSLRDKLFPEGLSHTKKSYRGEVGHAALVASQMDDATRAKLKAVALHEGTLLDYYDRWQAAAKQLDDLEEERATLTKTSPSVAFELRAARNAWVRMTRVLLTNAEVAGIDAATDDLLFSTLRSAERAASSRLRSNQPVVPPPVTPGTGPDQPPSPNSST
jgi:hypothetical protein